jgi:alkaline phosphatase
MCRILLFNFIVSWSLHGVAQPSIYSVANTHSHNDYENARPFRAAYENGFGSIEADIFLQHGGLIVAHDTRELLLNRTLEDLYLHPLDSVLRAHHGYVYADSSRRLQLLIDVKTEARTTLARLIETLQKYPALTSASSLHWVISGNRPPPGEFTSYPAYILFDGVISQSYDPPALRKIAMMSDDFRHYSSWNGQGELPAGDVIILQEAIGKVHAQKIPVRFWNAPDQPNAWAWFIRLKSDFINTDHISELAAFLQPAGAKGN